jgi:hypothetical protein
MARTYRPAATGVVLRVRMRHATTGQGLTGLTYQSSGLVIAAIADNEASGEVYDVAGGNIENHTGTKGTWSAPTSGKCKFVEVSSANHPGLYEIHLSNSRFTVSDARQLAVSWKGATNLLEDGVDIDLGIWDWWLNLGIGRGTKNSSERIVREAMRFLRNRIGRSGTTISIYQEDDSTADWTATVTTDPSGVPISDFNPA